MPSSHDGFLNEMRAARTALAQGNAEAAFGRLERAHILGQLRFFDHIVSHVWMLKVALQEQDGREIFGQVLRLGATIPGHLFGWLPIGNTGGANVSPLKPMPIPPDLVPYFATFSLPRQIVRQVMIIALIVAAAVWILPDMSRGLG